MFAEGCTQAQGVSAAKDEDKEDGEISTDDAAAEIRQKKIEDRDAAAAELKVLGTVFPTFSHVSPFILSTWGNASPSTFIISAFESMHYL